MDCKKCIHWNFCLFYGTECDDFESYEEEMNKAGLRTLDEIANELDEIFK